jgi:hypothetical protein
MARRVVLQFGAGEFCHALGDVRAGPYRHIHCLAVRREHDVAGMMAADRQMRHHRFGGPARGGVAVAIGETDHRTGIADIEPLWIGTRRIERHAERIAEPGGKHRRLRRCGAVPANDANAAGIALGDEQIAVRRCANKPRLAQAGGKKVDFKAVWDDWLLVATMHYSDDVPYRLGGIGCRQILRPDQPSRPWMVGTPVAKCGSALDGTGPRLRQQRDHGE